VAVDKKIVIITDGAASLQGLAEHIAAIIGNSGYSAAVIQAESFSGSELLSAYAFFLGCEKPEPSSFSYLGKLLGHINLAGRSCGIFSSDAKALNYLASLVHDSETAVGEPFLVQNGTADDDTLRHWIQSILKTRS